MGAIHKSRHKPIPEERAYITARLDKKAYDYFARLGRIDGVSVGVYISRKLEKEAAEAASKS